MKRIFRIGLASALLAGVFSCSSTTNKGIAAVPVDIFIYLSSPSFNSLNAVGGWAYVAGGNKGIVVFRKSLDEFNAFDRICTYDPDSKCSQTTVQKDGVNIKDSCCTSVYSIYDGNPQSGPSKTFLKKYNCSFDGNTVHITSFGI